MALERKTPHTAPATGASIRPPVEAGTDTSESLGDLIDNLMGDRKAARAGLEAALELVNAGEPETPHVPDPAEPLPDPEPAEAPPPVEEGTEVEHRGADHRD